MIELSYKKNLDIPEIDHIIEKYYDKKSKYTQKFIKEAIQRYGDIYEYSKTDRIDNNLTKVIITCPIHGDFLVDPQYFLRSPHCKGCPECNPSPFRKKSLAVFMEDLHKIFPEYEEVNGKTEYVNISTDIHLFCTKHHIEFVSRPGNLLQGKCGCPECVRENVSKSRVKLGKKKFEEEVVNVLKEDYDLGEYSSADEKIKVHCKKCNHVFYMSPENIRRHLRQNKKLCKKCRDEDYSAFKTDRFVKKCEKRYPKRFDYSDIVYNNSTSVVSNIKCNHCGKTFSIYPENFLHGRGCPLCSQSEGEIHVLEWINDNASHISCWEMHKKYSSDILQGRENDWGVVIDFVITSDQKKEFWVEYSGEQHYIWCDHFHNTLEKFKSQVQRDRNVRQYCSENNIVLIEIPWTFPREGIKDLLTEVIVLGGDPTSLVNIPEISYKRIKGGRMNE